MIDNFLQSVPAWAPTVTATAVLLALLVTLVVLLRRLIAASVEAEAQARREWGGSPPEWVRPPGLPLPLGAATWITAALALIACGVVGYLLGTSAPPDNSVREALALSATLVRSLFFAVVTIVLLRLFIRESAEERRPRVETHWGGLGGGLGGWAVSRSLVYLMAALLFGALTAMTSYAPAPAPASQGAGTDPADGSRQAQNGPRGSQQQQQGAVDPGTNTTPSPESQNAPARQAQPVR